jgi:predicted dehydrogenase
MAQPETGHSQTESSRRDFLKKSSAGVAGGSLLGVLATGGVHASVNDTIKVGLIGCGGRGGGAAKDALLADPHVELTAMADAFPDRIENKLKELSRDKEVGQKVKVDPEQRFTGFDAYKQLLETDVEVVLLTTPPHFRPMHLKAAIAAGKHVFCEKPVAVDAPGVRSVLDTVAEAKKQNLAIVSGLCWRYDYGVRETMKRVLDGAIGRIVAIQENYLAGTLWYHQRESAWSDMEYQVRNWLYYTWLSGDHNVEQHVHSLDKAQWAMQDVPPIRAVGLGGRQVRTDERWGNIFDHHAVVYEYPGDVRMFAFTRQQDGCRNETEDYILGTEGQCRVLRNRITGKVNWRYDGPKPSMYQVEHDELFAGLRSGNIINNGDYMAKSTMVAILGRMATYTGQSITWEEAINSKEDFTPKKYEWGPVEFPKVAMPGITPFV